MSAVTEVRSLLHDLDLPSCFSSSDLDRTATPAMAQTLMGGLYGSHQPDGEYAETAVVPSVNVREATLGDVQKLFEQTFERKDQRC